MLQIALAHRYSPLDQEKPGKRMAALERRLELPEFFHHGAQGYVVSLATHRDHAEVGEGGCDALLVPQLPVEGQPLLQEGLRRSDISLKARYSAGRVQRLCPQTGRRCVVAAVGEGPLQVASSLGL